MCAMVIVSFVFSEEDEEEEHEEHVKSTSCNLFHPSMLLLFHMFSTLMSD